MNLSSPKLPGRTQTKNGETKAENQLGRQKKNLGVSFRCLAVSPSSCCFQHPTYWVSRSQHRNFGSPQGILKRGKRTSKSRKNHTIPTIPGCFRELPTKFHDNWIFNVHPPKKIRAPMCFCWFLMVFEYWSSWCFCFPFLPSTNSYLNKTREKPWLPHKVGQGGAELLCAKCSVPAPWPKYGEHPLAPPVGTPFREGIIKPKNAEKRCPPRFFWGERWSVFCWQ